MLPRRAGSRAYSRCRRRCHGNCLRLPRRPQQQWQQRQQRQPCRDRGGGDGGGGGGSCGCGGGSRDDGGRAHHARRQHPQEPVGVHPRMALAPAPICYGSGVPGAEVGGGERWRSRLGALRAGFVRVVARLGAPSRETGAAAGGCVVGRGVAGGTSWGHGKEDVPRSVTRGEDTVEFNESPWVSSLYRAVQA